MKKKINVFDYAGDIMKALDKGVLITTKADGKVDSMTLGWGTLGIDWSLPVFTAYIRKSRFTKEQLEKNPEFTVNVPYGAFDPKILGVCGSKSGRDMDKAKELGLTLVDPEVISVPAVKELAADTGVPGGLRGKTGYRYHAGGDLKRNIIPVRSRLPLAVPWRITITPFMARS